MQNKQEKILRHGVCQARVLFIAVKLNGNRKLLTAHLQLQIKLCWSLICFLWRRRNLFHLVTLIPMCPKTVFTKRFSVYSKISLSS